MALHVVLMKDHSIYFCRIFSVVLSHYGTSSDEGSQYELAESSVWSHRIIALVLMRDHSMN